MSYYGIFCEDRSSHWNQYGGKTSENMSGNGIIALHVTGNAYISQLVPCRFLVCGQNTIIVDALC